MSRNDKKPISIFAKDAPPRLKPSSYPEPFASRMKGRTKLQLGDVFGLQKFGVNLTELAVGAESSLLHKHTKQEEFVYILFGNPTLVMEDSEAELGPGMCAGFSPSTQAHKLVNRTNNIVVYLEIGDRIADDEASYPADDLKAVMGSDGKWHYQHKDGRPY
jgi:uncharacterized cupin superfamily protein